jgi:hypothetical protein
MWKKNIEKAYPPTMMSHVHTSTSICTGPSQASDVGESEVYDRPRPEARAFAAPMDTTPAGPTEFTTRPAPAPPRDEREDIGDRPA